MITENSRVPEHLYKLLNLTTASLFMRYGYLQPFVIKTYNKGIQHLGDLVQMSEDDVFKAAPTSPKNRALIKKELADDGLAFGMSAPGWQKPAP